MKTAMNRRAAYALLAGAAGVFNTHSFAGAADGHGLNSFNSSLAPFSGGDWQTTEFDQAPPPNIGTGWSVANAGKFADKLSNVRTSNVLNDQAGALRNFLSLYAVTQQDGTNANGTWTGLSSYVKNGNSVKSALFGSGNQDSQGMIQNVWIGGDKPVLDSHGHKIDATPMTHFEGINSVLGRLGFVAAKGLNHKFEDTHYNHFHVDLRAPVRASLPNNLEAASTAPESDAPTVALTDLPVSYQELLVAAQTELQPQSGTLDMFVDLPPDSPHAVPIMMVAEAKQAQKPATAMRTVGVCEPMANLPDDPYFGRAILGFDAVAVNYLAKYEKVHLATQTAKITLLQPPAHGKLIGGGTYVPDRGFFGGQDQVSALVELGGYQVKVIYFIKVQPKGTGGIATDDDEMIREFCGPKGRMWKISTTTPSLQTLVGVNSGVVSDTSPYQLDSFTVTFGDLTGSAVGTTTGQGPTAQITLDSTAAGHGWYIDATPLDNTDDYLPTSNPNIWQAKTGGDAAGKMDMLSVLLHEYGHALGLDHSTVRGDFMAATLQTGNLSAPEPGAVSGN